MVRRRRAPDLSSARQNVGNECAPVPAGGKLSFSMHYTTTGKAATDATEIGYYTLKTPPEYIKRSVVISDGGGHASEGEDMEVLETTLDEALSQIAKGDILDAKTIMLVQHLALERATGTTRG